MDASAMVAIITDESDAFELERLFDMGGARLYSAMSLWESVRAIARKRTVSVEVANAEIATFITDFALQMVPIGQREATVAIEAHVRFGKGSGHPARLNMGDCFAYACARTNNARLLYKGDDFVHTDLG